MTPEERRQVAARSAQRALENIAPVLIVDAAIEKAHKVTGSARSEATMKLTHVAKKDRDCYQCGGRIQAGTQYAQIRERALSSYETRHAGMYPVRHVCAGCASK